MSTAPLLSVFRSAIDPVPVGQVGLAALVARIRSDELADQCQHIASLYREVGGGAAGKKATGGHKRALPAVTLAGTFDRRANADWREPSGLVQVDLDGLGNALAETWHKIITAPWVAAAWRSPSGDGIKAAVRCPGLTLPNGAHYRAAWQAVSRWLASLDLVNDPQAKDPARLSFLAHDPEAYHNPGAEPFPLDAWAESFPASLLQKVPHITQNPSRGGAEGIERRALAYVLSMPSSVEGSNGSAPMVGVVRALRDGFNLDGASLWWCLDAWNGERASPPWSRAELEHALANVEAVPPTRGRGWLLHAEPPAVTTGTIWPDPMPIRAGKEPPPFDLLGMIPAGLHELHDLADLGAEALQVPVEAVAVAAVGLAALASARSVEVELAQGWREPAPLWMLPLLRPGERKSATMGMLAHPFHAWTARERDRLSVPLARYAETRRGMEAQLAALRAKAAKANGEALARLRSEALDLAADLEAMPARLAAPDLLVQSYTPEGLRDLLELNGEKLGVVGAEADAAELLGARYSDAGPSIDLLLCAHAGDPCTTRRAGGRVIPLDRPAVGMVLAVQPEAVRAVLADRAAQGRGLVDRMMLVLPRSRLGTRQLDPAPIPTAVAAWWARTVGRILDLPWPGRCIVGQDGTPIRCGSPPRILGITPEARRVLWDLRDNLEPRLAEGADLAGMSGFASKLPGACARIALAFAMLRDPAAEMVEEEEMRAACAWAPFLLAHRVAVLGDATDPPEVHHARRLLRALERRGHPVMTGRELFDLVRDSALPTMTTFRPVLDLLADHGAIRRAAGETGQPGRPAERWEVNPCLLPGVSRDMRDNSGDSLGAA